MRVEYLIYGAGALGAILGVNYFLKLNRLSNELESDTRATIYSVTLDGITLRVNVTLKNPSGGTVRVKHPFIKMMHGNTVIASSKVKDVNVTIPKFSQVDLEPIMINIGFLRLGTTVPDLLKQYRSTGKLIITVKTISTINDSLPYTKTDELTLGGGQKA